MFSTFHVTLSLVWSVASGSEATINCLRSNRLVCHCMALCVAVSGIVILTAGVSVVQSVSSLPVVKQSTLYFAVVLAVAVPFNLKYAMASKADPSSVVLTGIEM